MAGVKTAANGKIKIALLVGADLPGNIETPLTVAKLTAAPDISCNVALNGFVAGFTASDTMSDPAVCESSNSQTRGSSNFQVALPIFWYIDATTGAYAALDNAAYEALKKAGTVAAIAVRRHKDAKLAWVSGDVYDIFLFETDEPQSSDGQGYVKKLINGLPRSARQDLVVAGA